MNAKTAYGTVYGIETLEEAQSILANADAEMAHEGCSECRGQLSIDDCAAAARVELSDFEARRDHGTLQGSYTAREIALVAILDAWAASQPKAYDALANTTDLLG